MKFSSIALVSVVVAATALPAVQASPVAELAETTRGRGLIKNVRLHKRKKSKKSKSGSRSYSKKKSKKSKSGSRSYSKCSKSKSRSCGGHAGRREDGHIYGGEKPAFEHPEDNDGGNVYEAGPAFPTNEGGNVYEAEQTSPTNEGGNVYEAEQTSPTNNGGNTYGAGQTSPTNNGGNTYGAGQTSPASTGGNPYQATQTAATPRVPAVCPSNEILTIVEAGDTLDKISKKNNYDLAAVIAANPQFANPDEIFPGDQVCIPENCKSGYKGPVVAPADTTLAVAPADATPVVAPEAVDVTDVADPVSLKSSAGRIVSSLVGLFALVLIL
ncbi:MAG: hypothetical protein SGCHY_003351 [Lobulomycetales sp.]